MQKLLAAVLFNEMLSLTKSAASRLDFATPPIYATDNLFLVVFSFETSKRKNLFSAITVNFDKIY